MIKNIFLPEKIGTYYLFPKRILGFDISKTHITVTQLLVRGESTIIEKIITHTLPIGTPVDYPDRVSLALKSLLTELDKADAIHSTLSSSQVLYKELTLPFTSHEKIYQVIEYEVEQLLPFPLEQAVIDFIITKESNGSSQVLVAAVAKTTIAEHLSYFQAAAISPQVITVDLFALYGLYRKIPSYQQFSNAVVLLDIGFSTTNIAYLINGQLLYVRTMQQGIGTIAKTTAENIPGAAAEFINDLMRFGFTKTDDESYNTKMENVFASFFQDITFTIDSFGRRSNAPLEHIIVLGSGADIPGVIQKINEKTEIPTQKFSIEELLHQKNITIKQRVLLDSTAIISLATAYPSPLLGNFNLRKKEFGIPTSRLFTMQIIVATAITIVLFSILIANSYKQINKLKTATMQAEKQTKMAIGQALDVSTAQSLDGVVEEARRKVDDQEQIWSSFSRQRRSSFLTYLQKLSSRIDKKATGLKLKQLQFSHDTIVLQGEVRNIDAVKLLEDELAQTNLGHVSTTEEPKFNITITLPKEEE